MKNIQVIDGAENCSYSVYAVSAADFKSIFPGPQQDVEFINDFIKRYGAAKSTKLLTKAWKRRIEKAALRGVHGTLFYELKFKKKYYPNKRESDLDRPARLRGAPSSL